MRNFFEPAEAPTWLRQVLTSIRSALSDIWPGPLRLKDYATADLPTAADFSGGAVWDSTLLTFRVSDGVNWLRFAAFGTGVLSFNTRTGAVTLTSGDVTGALSYTPTSVAGLTGSQTVAAFKTGLSLVKADVGLGNVDNTADTAKPVSTAQQTALNLKANLASPTFTGTVTVAALTASGAIVSNVAAGAANFQATGSSGSIADNATFDFPAVQNYGVLFIQETAATGDCCIVLFSAPHNSIVIVSQTSGNLYTTVAGSASKVNIFFTGSFNVRIENKRGGASTFCVSNQKGAS